MKHKVKKTSQRERFCGLCLTGARAWKNLPIAWYCETCGVSVCLSCLDSTNCQGKYARKNPADRADGISMYNEFYKFGPKHIGKFSAALEIPEQVYLVGSAEWVFYASDKWERKQNFYMHEHGWGTKCYLTDGGYDTTNVPDKFRKAETLVRLGECRGGPEKLPPTSSEISKNIGKTANTGKGLGFVWKDDKSGNLDGAIVTSPYPELYCTPDGKCLLVIENKKKIRALIWGGGMHVASAGIIG